MFVMAMVYSTCEIIPDCCVQIPTRTVKELVEFYYLWKKTERYDAFMQLGRIGKKKISCPPGQV